MYFRVKTSNHDLKSYIWKIVEKNDIIPKLYETKIKKITKIVQSSKNIRIVDIIAFSSILRLKIEILMVPISCVNITFTIQLNNIRQI
jgi:hypothetical protein